MNWASKHEPFFFSMEKWQINTKLCDLISEINFDFSVFYFSCVKIWLIGIPTHYQTCQTDIWKWLSCAPELKPFWLPRRKMAKKIKNPQLWHNIANYREEKEASQPHKIDRASRDLSIDIIFGSFWSLFIFVKYRTRYRGCWDPRYPLNKSIKLYLHLCW